MVYLLHRNILCLESQMWFWVIDVFSHTQTHMCVRARTHTHTKFYREESFTTGKSCLMNNAVIYDQQNCSSPSSMFVHLSCLLLICSDKSKVCVKYCLAPFLFNGNKTQQVTPYHNNLKPPKLKCRLIVEERLFCMASIWNYYFIILCVPKLIFN